MINDNFKNLLYYVKLFWNDKLLPSKSTFLSDFSEYFINLLSE